jgi:methyl-accepting chemotaxis protein
MATLKDTEQLTQQLHDLIGQLSSELQNGEVDFEKLISISDEISERADGMAETFSSVNEALMQRIQQIKGGDSGRKQGSRSQSKAGSRS